MPELEAIAPPINTGDGPKYDADKILLDEDPDSIVEEQEEDDEDDLPVDTDKEDNGEEVDEDEPEPPKVPFGRPSIKELKADFPELFTKYPELKDAIFREAKFTQFFPTVEDAKESFEDNEAFTVLSDAALAGDSAPMLQSLAKTDPKALVTFSASFLPNLYKQDQEAYSTAVTPLFENLLRQAYKAGDENMKNSALNLAQYLFGADGEDSVLGKKTMSKVNKILEEQTTATKERDNSQVAAFRSTAAFVSDNVLLNMKILVSKDFDPDKVFSKTIREMLVSDIITKIDKQLTQDQGHVTVMGARWKRARSNGYTDDDKSKLISTYLARAKSLIPTIREQVRSAALGKSIKASDSKRGKVQAPPREINGGAPPRGRQTQARDYSKMSDMEILNS